MNYFTAVVAAIACFAPPTTQDSDDLRRIEKQLLEMVPRFKTFSATLTLKIDFSGVQSWDRSDGRGTVEYLIQGDKIVSRVEITSESTASIGASESTTRDVHTMYGDGKYTFDVGETNGTKMAFKLDTDPIQVAVPSKEMFDKWRKDFETKILPDENLDGKEVWVLEARPKDPEKTPAARMLTYFRKDIPLMVKTVSYDKYDRPFQWTTLTEIKVDPKIDPERFVFKRPPDFEYYDVTTEK
ncbi:MAG TPA: outer membrane lipoprotein-sorting protein [Phycisphaerae bacterium]|nr:outer membrane lipoprotein-sorting protein [Phycisphaerae bacterium]